MPLGIYLDTPQGRKPATLPTHFSLRDFQSLIGKKVGNPEHYNYSLGGVIFRTWNEEAFNRQRSAIRDGVTLIIQYPPIISEKSSEDGPAWRQASVGLCLDGVCLNAKCKAFENKELKFDSNSIYPRYLSFDISPPIFISSTLLKLHVNVTHFYDLIYLLDGRFNQLQLLHVTTFSIQRSSLRTINNMENLPNLKYFLLYCKTDTVYYDELILPLLHRMLNLEKLHLCLKICGRKTFIHGNNLKINILNHMQKLNQFTFNIRSTIRLHNKISLLLSNEDIQNTFNDFQNNKIISCVDYFSEMERGQCHIYSYPYQLIYYHQITNNFSGGIFKYVREISLFDEQPFEHEFFFQIS
ncbi:unnamed protein product [Rotaria sp. Silwood2]|nr:unnamed protein product [Rotaria sp. Silwood2]